MFVHSAEDLVFFLVISIMKVDFEAEVVSAINTVFPDSVITGCNFNFSQCLWRQLKNISLMLEYKKERKKERKKDRKKKKERKKERKKEVRLTCRMCAALAYLSINKVEEDWLIIMKIFHRKRN